MQFSVLIILIVFKKKYWEKVWNNGLDGDVAEWCRSALLYEKMCVNTQNMRNNKLLYYWARHLYLSWSLVCLVIIIDWYFMQFNNSIEINCLSLGYIIKDNVKLVRLLLSKCYNSFAIFFEMFKALMNEDIFRNKKPTDWDSFRSFVSSSLLNTEILTYFCGLYNFILVFASSSILLQLELFRANVLQSLIFIVFRSNSTASFHFVFGTEVLK